jgi:pilus assembly protein Flp/PilA
MGRIRALPALVATALVSARTDEDGQAMVEYALLLFLVSIVSIAVLTTLGGSVSSIFDKINNDL